MLSRMIHQDLIHIVQALEPGDRFESVQAEIRPANGRPVCEKKIWPSSWEDLC